MPQKGYFVFTFSGLVFPREQLDGLPFLHKGDSTSAHLVRPKFVSPPALHYLCQHHAAFCMTQPIYTPIL